MQPQDALERIAYLLERSRQPTYRVRAFRNAAAAVGSMAPGELEDRAASGRLRAVPGIGERTAEVIQEALAGRVPSYLERLESEATAEDAEQPMSPGAAALRAALRGDCHSHSDWSDGGSPLPVMAAAAREQGHEYWAITDHSPRLTVAHGLNPERLRQQLDLVAEINEEMAPFRVLTGCEVDILEDGTLDQEPEVLDRLDVVVASVHSKLRMERDAMTKRMVRAVADPHVDILGHCTGRLIGHRPESTFDAELVFAACAKFDKAVEINSRPERRDPPKRLLRLALELGCRVSIDTDAHAPGQLEWQRNGCEQAAACDVPVERVVNTWSLDQLLAWTAAHAAA